MWDITQVRNLGNSEFELKRPGFCGLGIRASLFTIIYFEKLDHKYNQRQTHFVLTLLHRIPNAVTMADDQTMGMKENVAVSHILEVDEPAGLPIIKRPRVTPRSSTAGQEPKQTPHANVRLNP